MVLGVPIVLIADEDVSQGIFRLRMCNTSKLMVEFQNNLDIRVSRFSMYDVRRDRWRRERERAFQDKRKDKKENEGKHLRRVTACHERSTVP